MPGETVQYTLTQAATGSGGALARPRVGQFTVAAGGTGNGNFQPGSTCGAGYYPRALTLADVDADGDLDFLTANYSPAGTVSIRLNDGTGTFGGGQAVSVGNLPSMLKVGDLDGDGDLDLLTGNTGNVSLTSTVSIRLNDGTGTFSGSQEVPVGIDPSGIALGDIDGDGDLDLLVANGGSSSVGVYLNPGNGTFASSRTLVVEKFSKDIALGDADNDGDLDLFVPNGGSNVIALLLNDGNGLFGSSRNIAINGVPGGLGLGDLDGDNDLDLVATNLYAGVVSVRFNNGNGDFGGDQEVSVGWRPATIALGDFDGDGDLDFLATNENANTISARLNNGRGAFSAGLEIGAATGTAVGDVDGDGDLDFMTADANANPAMSLARVMLNQVAVLATTNGHPAAGLALFPNPAHGTTTLTGLAPHAACTLLDALGRILLTSTADAAGRARLQLPDGLPAGIYLVRYGSLTRRLTVQ